MACCRDRDGDLVVRERRGGTAVPTSILRDNYTRRQTKCGRGIQLGAAHIMYAECEAMSEMKGAATCWERALVFDETG